MRTASIYDVMVASPADCRRDRGIVIDAILQWNLANRPLGIRFEPLDGELHTFPEAGTQGAQAYVDRQLVDDSDLLVGLFWTRLGTATSKAPSGTVHELEQILKQNKPAGLFFSRREADPASLDLDQLGALHRFRESHAIVGLGSSYATFDDLKAQLKDFLSAHAHRLLAGASPEVSTSLKKTQQSNSLYDSEGDRQETTGDTGTTHAYTR